MICEVVLGFVVGDIVGVVGGAVGSTVSTGGGVLDGGSVVGGIIPLIIGPWLEV